MQGLRWLRLTAYNVAAIALGVAAGLVVVSYAGGNVGVALSTLFLGPITSAAGIQQIFVRFVIFYTMALGVGLALKAGLWNIGAQGQFIVGMVMIFVVYQSLVGLPIPLIFVSMMIVAAIGGLLWIVVPTVLRVKYGANEIVVTLLLNVVALNFATYMLNGPIRDTASYGYPVTVTLPTSLQIPPIVGGLNVTYAVPFTVLVGVILYFAVEKTAFRVKANTVGESIPTAKYAGIGISRVMVITMLAAGALAGLAGATYIMGYLIHLDPGQFQTNFGFLAVIAALVGRKNMLGIGVASLFFGYITIGSEYMAVATSVQTSVVFAMEGVMLVGLLLSSYFMERRR